MAIASSGRSPKGFSAAAGQAPAVDTQNVIQQKVLSRDLLDTIPTGKTFSAYASVTPGAILPATFQDVGGNMGRLRPGVGVPLVRVKSLAGYSMDDDVPKLDPSTLPGDLLYTTSLGKGRIVAFGVGGPTPKPLQEATGNRFVIRVCRWLAGREVE